MHYTRALSCSKAGQLTLILSFFLFVSSFSYGQEKYQISYDYQTERVNYYRLNKLNQIVDTLAKPKIKRNSLVEIKLKNVNPFAVNVLTNVKEEELHQSGQGFNFSSLLGGIGSFGGSKLKLNIDKLPADTLFSKSLASRGKSMVNKFSELNTLVTKVSAIKNSLISNLLNPNLDKKTISENLIKTSKSIEDARIETSPDDNYQLFLSNLEKIIIEDGDVISSDILMLQTNLEDNSNQPTLLKRGEIIERNTGIANLEKMLASLKISGNDASDNLGAIRSMFSMLEAATFDKIYDYELEADKVNIELKFVKSNFAKAVDKAPVQTVLKTRNIKLFSKGGFKINTSIALTLNNFGSKSNDFYVDDNGVIGADPNDYFVPNLSTMVNFYPMAGENFNVGGSFGLSIPISDNIGGINFLLGPSIFFGSKNRISISGGAAYGPVKRLTNGLQIGNTATPGGIDKFTKNVYDLGYYFGISFSLFDIK